MSDKWHYLMNGTQHGPVPFEELQRLAASGEIKETDEVWQQGSASDWMAARKVPNLVFGRTMLVQSLVLASEKTPAPEPPEWAARNIAKAQTAPPGLGTVQRLAVLALRPLVGGACSVLGIPGSQIVTRGVGEIVRFLSDRFRDDSQRLTVALRTANENAWKSLEIALAGASLWNRLTAKGEDKSFVEQIRLFLDHVASMPEKGSQPDFRQRCLDDLRAARKKGVLTGNYDGDQLAEATGEFARYADPVGLLNAEWEFIGQLADTLDKGGHKHLSFLLRQKPSHGLPLLVTGVRYFFRRAVEEDNKLFQGLAFAKLESLGEGQEKGFAALSQALSAQGQRLEELLSDLQAVVVETHGVVLEVRTEILDLKAEKEREKFERQDFYDKVMKTLETFQLQKRELRASDSLSIRNDAERHLVKQLVARYRSLPEQEKQQTPALLNALGKLEIVAGDFDAAQNDFQQVATLVSDSAAQAEAHYNAYRASLERRDWNTGLQELLKAVKLDGKRFAPFPIDKYQPHRFWSGRLWRGFPLSAQRSQRQCGSQDPRWRRSWTGDR